MTAVGGETERIRYREKKEALLQVVLRTMGPTMLVSLFSREGISPFHCILFRLFLLQFFSLSPGRASEDRSNTCSFCFVFMHHHSPPPGSASALLETAVPARSPPEEEEKYLIFDLDSGTAVASSASASPEAFRGTADGTRDAVRCKKRRTKHTTTTRVLFRYPYLLPRGKRRIKVSFSFLVAN